MKKTFGIFAVLFFLLAMQACKDDATTPGIEVPSDPLEFSSVKSTLELKVSCGTTWTISSDKTWCTILGVERENQPCKDKVLTIHAEKNNSLQERTATITITQTGGKIETVAVTQSAASELPPVFKSFQFREITNPEKLRENIVMQIKKEIVAGNSSFIIEDKVLIPEFHFDGGKVYMGDKEIVSGQTEIDFSGPVTLVIKNSDGEQKQYTINLASLRGLPVVYINTNGVPIDSKDNYVAATIKIVDNNGLRPSSIFENSKLEVKGRGNSTWGMPKKPYRLKFDKKQSLLGEPADKSWVLLANYMDDDNGMRNATAYSLGHLSCLPFTPTVHFVELFLNGEYNGLYQLCEQMKISADRVNVTNDGYLIEAEQRDKEEDNPDDIYFWAKTISPEVNVRFCIKDPDVDRGGVRHTEIENCLNVAQNAIYATNFKDPNTGYAKYLNVDTYVDWYVISEITNNNDAYLYTSCYMNIGPIASGSKLNMGPMWDYDICINNSQWNNTNATDYHNWNSPWFSRMLEDPAFRQKVKDRIAYFKANLPVIFEKMDKNAEYIKLAAIKDDQKWHSKGTSDAVVEANFTQHVSNMKSWLTIRLNWLNQASFEK